MAEIKTVRGIISCAMAKEDTRVVVDDAFSIVIPKGMKYSTDPNEIGEGKLLTAFVPNLADGQDGDDYDMQYGISQKRFSIIAHFNRFNDPVDFSDEGNRKVVENAVLEATKQALSLTGDDGCGAFLIKSDPGAIVAAADGGVMGNAGFHIALPIGTYMGLYHIADESGFVLSLAGRDECRRTAKKWFGGIEGIGTDDAESSASEDKPLLVSDLSYSEGLTAQVGAFRLPVPDGTVCANAGGSGKPIPAKYRGSAEFICVPASYSRGFGGYEDASFSIVMGKPNLIDGIPSDWSGVDVQAVGAELMEHFEETTAARPMKKPFEMVELRRGFMSCCCLLSGEDKGEGSWRSYKFVVVTGTVGVAGNVYFNQQAPEAAMEKAVKDWLGKITPSNSALAVEKRMRKERLGPYGADNGKMDAITMARLFAEDVLFFPQEKFDRSGGKLNAKPQVNSQKRGEHPFIFDNFAEFTQAEVELMMALETREDLKLPGNKLHPKLLTAALDDRLTGLSFLNLMAYHMVKIVEDTAKPNSYTVIIDNNVVSGMPDAYNYVIKFIRFCREYNEKPGGFGVIFHHALNLDSPISGSLPPVPGAAVGKAPAGMCGFTVAPNGAVTEGATMSLNVGGQNVDLNIKRSPESTRTNKDLERELDENIVTALRRYAEYAYIEFNNIPIELKGVSFDLLINTQEVVDKIQHTLSINTFADGMRGALSACYWENYVSYEDDPLSGVLFFLEIPYMYEEKGNSSFDPNKLPQQLISAVKALTKDEIYHDVLKQAVNSKACGRHLIAPREETVKPPIVKAPSNIPDSDSSDIELAISGLMDIELSGTKYEGRSARIENVKVGDIVQLVREPDNPYDSNAIDVRNAAGSLGHIPSDIAELLAKRLDSGAVTAKAVVTEVLPKSQRGKGAKKAVLKIRLNSDATGEEKPKYDRKGKSPASGGSPAPSQNAPKGKDGRKNKPSGKKPAPSSSAAPRSASAQKPAEETPEQKRERFYKRRREELRRELEKAQKELEPQEKKAEEERQKELAEYNAIQKELEGLGAFSFLKKSALRARLEAMGPAMESAQKMRDLHLLAPRKKVERLQSRIDMIGTVKGEIEEIYDVIYFHGPITAQDIENRLSVLFEGSTRYISHIRRLVSDGRVIREEIHGKTVYSAVKF